MTRTDGEASQTHKEKFISNIEDSQKTMSRKGPNSPSQLSRKLIAGPACFDLPLRNSRSAFDFRFPKLREILLQCREE